MRQDDYEIIVSCIEHGAPALRQRLISAINNVITDRDKVVTELRRIEAEKAKAIPVEHFARPATEAEEQERATENAEQMSLPL